VKGVTITKYQKKRLKHEATGSRKCGCIFMLHGYLSRETNNWRLNILNRVHNHEMKPSLERYILAGRLREDEKKIVRDLTRSLVQPKNILINLKGKRQESMTNIKQVYNERQKIFKSNRGNKTEMQYLISKFEEYKYIYFTRTQSENTAIHYIFWAHPTSVKLFNNFPTVVVMDSTSKTNMYMMPLFEIVEVTSTNMTLTYSIGFGFLTVEKEDNFIWVL